MWPEEDSEDGMDFPSLGDAVSCLEFLSSLPLLHDALGTLMRERNMNGYTPFMAATGCKVFSLENCQLTLL